MNNAYYHLKPIIPRRLQLFLRRKIILRKRVMFRNVWPIDGRADKPPQGWPGWPGHKKFAVLLTHDVETLKGHEKCGQLMRLEESLGFKSSFYFVPERYNVSLELRRTLTGNGFEVGVHGLYHDGKLYQSKQIFQERSIQINCYLREWDSVGFRSPSMHHNLDWIHDLNIEYDASTFDTDPFEPQPEGVQTIFPFLVLGNPSQKEYVELPYTLPQDFTLFVLMKERNIDIWKKKLDWIAERRGMVLLNTHPDYMNFKGENLRIDEYPSKYYEQFLQYVKNKYEGDFWHVLPRNLARFWSKLPRNS